MHRNTRFLSLTAVIVGMLATILFSGVLSAKELEKTYVSDIPFLVPNHGYTMSFVRLPGMKGHEATLRITQPVSVNGCVKVTVPKAESKIIGPNVKVIVSAPIIQVDKTRQYGHGTCKQNLSAVASDITLNRDELIKGRVNKIDLTGPGGMETYDLHVDKHKMYLYKKVRDAERGVDMRVDYFEDKYFFKPSKSAARHAPLTHWFLPENVVILNAPKAEHDMNVNDKIVALASKQGFIKLDTFMHGYEPASTARNTVYFVDQTGGTYKSLKHGEVESFGTITAGEIFHGPNGPYERKKEIEVVARLPGVFE